MSIHTKHDPAHCDVCAAQQEADAIGAIPTAGHEPQSLQFLSEQIAEAIRIGDQRKVYVTNLLLAFAEEIKREAIEP